MNISSELAAELTEVRRLNNNIDLVLQYKEIENPKRVDIMAIAKLHSPGLFDKASNLLKKLTDRTQAQGHSQDMDRLKEEMFVILGRCTGEEI